MKIPIRKNTITNFISMFVRLLQGILVARWMIADLGEAQYGLWSMLWVFFSFALLLDLGFGVTAQKATATELWKTDLKKYNQTISSLFTIHLLLSALIIPVTLTAVVYVRELFHLPPGLEDVTYYRTCIILCGFCAAAVFPLGVFQEILVGLHKLYLRNYIQITSKILEFIGVMMIFFFHGGLISLIIYSIIIIGLSTQIAMMICVYRSIPGLRVRPWITRSAMLDIADFSASAYLISIGRLIWERGAALLLSMFCGLTPVGFFQLGSRLPLLVQQLAMPYIENLSPIAARLHARHRQKNLSVIQNHLIRWVNFFAAGITVAIILGAPKILYLLFHISQPRVILICRLMMLLTYGLLVLRLIPEKSLTMVGEHRFLATVFLLEDVFFLIITVVFLRIHCSELSIIAGMILCKGATTALVIVPKFFRLNQIPLRPFLFRTLGRPLAVGVVTGALAYPLYHCLILYFNEWLCFFGVGIASGIFYLAVLYRFILDRVEKLQVHAVFRYIQNKLRKVSPHGTQLQRP